MLIHALCLWAWIEWAEIFPVAHNIFGPKRNEILPICNIYYMHFFFYISVYSMLRVYDPHFLLMMHERKHAKAFQFKPTWKTLVLLSYHTLVKRITHTKWGCLDKYTGVWPMTLDRKYYFLFNERYVIF